MSIIDLFKRITASKKALFGLILTLSFLLYGNTLFHQYALDDAIVITENQFTQQGVAGISGILLNDTFYGFFKKEGKDKLVAGGRYRPMSLVAFAIGWQIWGDNPFMFHLFNILFYALLAFLIHELLISFSKTKHLLNGYFPLLVTLLFIAHPIHTEVVANIKGRDEIFALLGSLLAMFFITKAVKGKSMAYNAFAAIAFLFALLSKENAITFLAIIPLSLMLLNNEGFKTALIKSWPAWSASIIFIAIRTSVVGLDFGDTPRELMNNPFIKLENHQYVDFNLSERMSAIMYSLGYYIKLLVYPHPLTHDYYPRQINITHLSNPMVILSICVHLVMLFIALLKFKKTPIISYSILFYLFSLSIVSNIVFPVGTNMAERFIFMPSLGFCLLLAYGFNYIYNRYNNFAKYGLVLLLFAYSAKTISRNTVWKNDFTLFTTDVKTSSNSAKCLNAAGGAIQTKAFDMQEGPARTVLLKQGVSYLNKAIEIHPNYKNAHLLMGNCQFYLKNYKEAVRAYENALRISPDYVDAQNNLAVSYREYGKEFGEKYNNLEEAIKYLNKSLEISSDDSETLRLLGVAYGIAQNHLKAVEYFEQLVILEPQSASAFATLHRACKNAGLSERADEAYRRAIALDPNAFN